MNTISVLNVWDCPKVMPSDNNSPNIFKYQTFLPTPDYSYGVPTEYRSGPCIVTLHGPDRYSLGTPYMSHPDPLHKTDL